MTVKRFPKKSDFAFLAPLWDLAKDPRNGLLCGDNIPSLMKANGFERVEDESWSSPKFYGVWTVVFYPEDETLWVVEANKATWEEPRVLEIKDPAEMVATVKLKLCNAVTLADQNAPLGLTPSGSVIFEITHVPGWVSMQQVCREYQGFVAAWNGKKLSFEYAPQA